MNWQQYERDLPFLMGAAMAINDINAQNQANAEYNAVMQGYMSQGYTAEQAKMLTDEHFRPQWVEAAAQRQYRHAKWCVAICLFLLFGVFIFATDGTDASSIPVTVVFAILVGWLAVAFTRRGNGIRAQLSQTTVPTSTIACKCGWQHTYVDQQHAEAAAEKHWAAKHAPRGITAQ